jgi:hypothetical protein
MAIIQPGVDAQRLRRENVHHILPYPERVVAEIVVVFTQGSAGRATLGWMLESFQDSQPPSSVFPANELTFTGISLTFHASELTFADDSLTFAARKHVFPVWELTFPADDLTFQTGLMTFPDGHDVFPVKKGMVMDGFIPLPGPAQILPAFNIYCHQTGNAGCINKVINCNSRILEAWENAVEPTRHGIRFITAGILR